MNIGELAQRAGVETSTIRYYEQTGILPKPKRINGRRIYDEKALRQLGLIKAVKAAGFTIAEIKALTSAWEAENHAPKAWREFVERKLAEIETLMAQAERTRQVLTTALECGCWDDYDIPLEAFIAQSELDV
ncbi:MAG: MerR family transcriptional regulator [Anaerolineae bacterium]